MNGIGIASAFPFRWCNLYEVIYFRAVYITSSKCNLESKIARLQPQNQQLDEMTESSHLDEKIYFNT